MSVYYVEIPLLADVALSRAPVQKCDNGLE